MHGPFFLLILVPLLFVVLAVAVVLKLASGLFSRSGREEQAEEARMIQEMYAGMTRMEQRIEVLETLLLEQDAKEK